MKKIILLTMLLGLTGCGETDQNDTSQATLQIPPSSINYRMAATASTLSAPAASFGQWVINGYSSEGASTVVNASRTIGGVATESKALITPNVSQVSKILRAGLGGFALTYAVDELLDGIDWVMDPANNRIKYFKTTCPTNDCVGWYFGNTFLTAVTDPESACNAFWSLRTDLHAKYLNGGPYVYTDISIRCTWNDKYGWLEGSNLVNYITNGKEESTLSLDVVSQEIINNAESGNADAQAVTLAAAQAIVSEAENDATKAKEIEDEFERNSDEKCKNHNLKMNSKAAMVEWRYEELYKDRFNLYINHTEVSNPLILNGKNKGSWDGHVSQYKYAQGVLRATIKSAFNAGCPATPKANFWVNKEPPSQPGIHS